MLHLFMLLSNLSALLVHNMPRFLIYYRNYIRSYIVASRTTNWCNYTMEKPQAAVDHLDQISSAEP